MNDLRKKVFNIHVRNQLIRISNKKYSKNLYNYLLENKYIDFTVKENIEYITREIKSAEFIEIYNNGFKWCNHQDSSVIQDEEFIID